MGQTCFCRVMFRVFWTIRGSVRGSRHRSIGSGTDVSFCRCAESTSGQCPVANHVACCIPDTKASRRQAPRPLAPSPNLPVRGTAGTASAEGGAAARTAELRLLHVYCSGVAKEIRGVHSRSSNVRRVDRHRPGRGLPRPECHGEQGWRRRREPLRRGGQNLGGDSVGGGVGPGGNGMDVSLCSPSVEPPCACGPSIWWAVPPACWPEPCKERMH